MVKDIGSGDAAAGAVDAEHDGLDVLIALSPVKRLAHLRDDTGLLLSRKGRTSLAAHDDAADVQDQDLVPAFAGNGLFRERLHLGYDVHFQEGAASHARQQHQRDTGNSDPFHGHDAPFQFPPSTTYHLPPTFSCLPSTPLLLSED